MRENLPRRRDTRTADGFTGRKPLKYDRHGDPVELDDSCGATVGISDQIALRLLARSEGRS